VVAPAAEAAADRASVAVAASDASTASADAARAVEPPVAAPRAGSRVVQLCGGCEGVNDVDARFCKHCGAALSEAGR